MRMTVGIVSSLGLAAACGDLDRDTEVLVRVTDRPGAPVANADVWSHAADGARIGYARTGADGVAIVPVVTGGAVTVHERFSSLDTSGEWRTRLDIAPGDELAFVIQGGNDVVPDPDFTSSTEFTLPPLPPDTWRIQLRSPCGRANSFVASQTLRLNSSCEGPTTVVATVTDSTYATIGYAVVRDVDLRTTATVVVPGVWQVPSATWTVDLRGVPAGVDDVYATRSLAAAPLAETAHNDTLVRNGLAMGDTAIAERRPDVADPAHYTVRVGSWGRGYRHVRSTNQAPVDGIVVDLAATDRPVLEHSADGRLTSWTPMPEADLVTLEHVVTTSRGDVVGSEWTWHVTAPPHTSSFDFFTDTGFPFVGSGGVSSGAHIDHLAVSAWHSTWFPAYDELRTLAAPPPPPSDAAYTLRIEGDAFEDAQ